MGKASTSKKVARAAGIGGGRTYRRNRPWGYFGIIALIVLLGVVGTVTSRDRRLSAINAAGDTAPTVGTTWHEGYAVYVCGHFLPPISSTKSPDGIHTQSPGDGIITIAPTVKSAAGKNAVLSKFTDAVGMTLNAADLKVPGGHLYSSTNSCEGHPGEVYVKHFADVGDTIGKLYNGSKEQLPKIDPRFVPLGDQEMLTIAFVPSGQAASIPPPPQYVINNLNKLAASSTTSSTTTTPVPST